MRVSLNNYFEFYVDGASKGNPGPSGIGVVVCRHGEVIKNISTFIGEGTNNVAEYTALIYALKEGISLGAEQVKVNTDSELLYRQIRKIYKIKHPNIQKLYNQALELILAFKGFSINYIPREQNKGADKLATLAVKKQLER